jgi:hypothetical protein
MPPVAGPHDASAGGETSFGNAQDELAREIERAVKKDLSSVFRDISHRAFNVRRSTLYLNTALENCWRTPAQTPVLHCFPH